MQEMLNTSQGEGPVENRLQSIEKQLADLTSNINKLSSNSNLPSNNEATPAPHTGPPDQFALKIVDEYRDRERRKLNLIFHKIPESKSSDTSTCREDDKKSVLNVVKEIGVNQCDILNVVSLGQFNESKVRLRTQGRSCKPSPKEINSVQR